MASASSNRYQSRLFSFIHKQSRFLTNRLNRVLKTVTSWIAPIVFYPSLPQKIKQNVRSLPKSDSAPPTVDTPIEKVLLLIEALPPEEPVTANPVRNFLGFLSNKFFPKVSSKLSTNTNSYQILQSRDNNSSSSLVQRPQFRGIASLISNRLLVLVTPHNEVLDVLTSQQQQVLQERIIGEVANYWRWQRLLQSQHDKLPGQIWLLAPTKVFGSIVNWGRKDKQKLKISFFSDKALASLDRTIAKFETNNLASVASITKAFQIQGLIWAAIDYFFGDCAPRSAGGDRTGKLIQPTQTTTDNELADPWLTMSDLFGSEVVTEESLILENPTNSTVSYLPEDKNLTQSQKINKYSLHNLLNRWRLLTQKVGRKSSASLLVKSTQAATNLTKIKKQASAQLNQNSNSYTKRQATIATNSPALNLSSSVAAKSSERPEQSDWIETNATTMGYVKHPLEQLLEWLDLAILWVENIFVKFWRWLQKY